MCQADDAKMTWNAQLPMTCLSSVTCITNLMNLNVRCDIYRTWCNASDIVDIALVITHANVKSAILS